MIQEYDLSGRKARGSQYKMFDTWRTVSASGLFQDGSII
jgi:hypothetical protein